MTFLYSSQGSLIEKFYGFRQIELLDRTVLRDCLIRLVQDREPLEVGMSQLLPPSDPT